MDSDVWTIVFKLWINLVLIQASSGENLCNEQIHCPTHKRFCTPAGCVYKCPEYLYVNGSTCVLSCNDWFITAERNCLQECPDEFFVREDLTLIGQEIFMGKQCLSSCVLSEYSLNRTCLRACPAAYQYNYNRTCVTNCPFGFLIRESAEKVEHEEFIHKQCIDSCDTTEFIINDTCIKYCPEDMRYIHRNVCVSTCPAGYNFINNFTRNGVLHQNCLEKCPRYEENSYCVDLCSAGYFSFESSCLPFCPDSHPLNQLGACVDQCGPELLFVNGTCQYTCSNELQYVYNRTCILQCPKEASFISSEGSNICVDKCSAIQYYFAPNMSCLFDCPDYSFKYEKYPNNKTCVFECPSDSPLICDSVCFKNMSGLDSASGICVERCPPTSPCVNNSVCVTECWSSICFNETCVAKCPKEFPYTVSKFEYSQTLNGKWIFHQFLDCISTCDPQYFIIKEEKTCVDICPENMVIVNRTCLQSCPSDLPLRKNVSVLFQSTAYNRTDDGVYGIETDEIAFRFRCFGTCEEGEAEFDKTCYDICRRDNSESTLFYHNGSCLEKCPDSHRFIGNKTTTDSCESQFGCKLVKWQYECLKECSTDTFNYHGNFCVDYCPGNLTAYGNICVNTCPRDMYRQIFDVKFFVWTVKKSYFFYYNQEYFGKSQVTVLAQKCVSLCEHSVVNGQSCVKTCPIQQLYIHDNVCNNQTCLTRYQYNSSYGIQCLSKCPNDTYVFMNKCLNSCPVGMVSNASVCMTTCPDSEPNLFTIPSINLEWGIANDKEWRFTINKYEDKICCSKCPKGYDLFNMTCLERCPSAAFFTFNGECKSNCSAEGYLELDYQCVELCPADYLLEDNKKCVRVCPWNAKYIYNGACVTQCPKDKPFGIKTKDFLSYRPDKFECRSECWSDYIYKSDEDTCVSSEYCEKPYIVFGGQCLLRCPYGYLWFTSCFHRLAVSISIGIFGVFIALTVYHSRFIAKDSWYLLKGMLDNKIVDDFANEYFKTFHRVETVQSTEMPGYLSLEIVNLADSCVFQALGNESKG